MARQGDRADLLAGGAHDRPRDRRLRPAGRGRVPQLCIVSIKKAFPGHARKVMNAIWGLGMLSLTKGIVVVDAHVDVHDYAEVMFYVGANVDPERDVISEGPARPPRPRPDPAVLRRQDRHRRDREGAARGNAGVAARDRDERGDRGLVDRRWDEYGFEIGSTSRKRPDASEFAPPVTTLTTCAARVESHSPLTEPHDDHPHVPGPSLWPVGFAVGVVVLLVGLVISWWVAGVGALIALAFAFLWVRDLTLRDRARARTRRRAGDRRRALPQRRLPPRRRTTSRRSVTRVRSSSSSRRSASAG